MTALKGEVIGYRQWIVNPDLQLGAAAMHYTWDRGVNEAWCMADASRFPCGQPCPSVACECGLYGLHSPDFWYTRDRFDVSNRYYVAGLISAWGRMQVHHDGFRAQYAQVVAIAYPEGKRDAAIPRIMAAEYRVPAVPQAELERVAAEFGSTVPAKLRPEKVSAEMQRYWGQATTNAANTQLLNQLYTSNTTSAADLEKQLKELRLQQIRFRELNARKRKRLGW